VRRLGLVMLVLTLAVGIGLAVPYWGTLGIPVTGR
jgi:hypothetical protein